MAPSQREVRAAVKIQAAFRGYLTRKYVVRNVRLAFEKLLVKLESSVFSDTSARVRAVATWGSERSPCFPTVKVHAPDTVRSARSPGGDGPAEQRALEGFAPQEEREAPRTLDQRAFHAAASEPRVTTEPPADVYPLHARTAAEKSEQADRHTEASSRPHSRGGRHLSGGARALLQADERWLEDRLESLRSELDWTEREITLRTSN